MARIVPEAANLRLVDKTPALGLEARAILVVTQTPTRVFGALLFVCRRRHRRFGT